MAKGSHTAWLVSLPLALAGLEAAHAVGNMLAGAPEPGAEVFETPGSGAGLLPLVAALAVAFVAAGLVARIAGGRSGSHRSRSLALPFALIAPVGFIVLEAAEGIAGSGAVPWGEATAPAFLVGLALQLPFALAGYQVARLLLRAGDGIRSLLERRRAAVPAGRPRRVRFAPPADDAARSRAVVASRGGRAPPGPVAAFG
jgi:hypothetical protein